MKQIQNCGDRSVAKSKLARSLQPRWGGIKHKEETRTVMMRIAML